jgi:ketosteroid isomerase-like protein
MVALTEPRQIALAFLQSFWDGAPERGQALCAPDARWTFQKSLREPRLAAIGDAVEWLNARLVREFHPDSGYTVDVRNVIAEGEEVAIEYGARGKTCRGDWYENDYLVRFTVRDGLIRSVRPYFDTHYVHRVLARLD